MSDKLIDALKVFARFQGECGERAKYAVLYPLVRDPQGRNLRHVMEEAGFPFRETLDALVEKGFLKSHGWRGKNGATGVVFSLTEQGKTALADSGKSSKSKGKSKDKSKGNEDLVALLIKALQEVKG